MARIVDILGCPHCGSAMELLDGAVYCRRGHSFDVARQGYVSLLTGSASKITGDSADMLAARTAFQQAGHFEPIAAAIAAAAASVGGAVAEIGVGTGYYLARLLDEYPALVGVGFDISKPAARRCARAHPRAAAVVADVWHGLPLRTGSVGLVLSVFGPRNPAEVQRALAPDGVFVVVTPTPRHLAELVGPIGMVAVDEDKPRRLGESLTGRFAGGSRTLVEYPMTLTHADIESVVAMGPSAHHVTPGARATRIAALPDPMRVTASVTVRTYTPR